VYSNLFCFIYIYIYLVAFVTAIHNKRINNNIIIIINEAVTDVMRTYLLHGCALVMDS